MQRVPEPRNEGDVFEAAKQSGTAMVVLSAKERACRCDFPGKPDLLLKQHHMGLYFNGESRDRCWGRGMFRGYVSGVCFAAS